MTLLGLGGQKGQRGIVFNQHFVVCPVVDASIPPTSSQKAFNGLTFRGWRKYMFTPKLQAMVPSGPGYRES